MKGVSNWLIVLIFVVVMLLLILVFGAVTVDFSKIPIISNILNTFGLIE